MTTSSDRDAHDRLDLRGARVVHRDGYPLLELAVGDRTATLTTEWKPAVRARGWVYLGDEFAAVVPERTLIDDDSGTVHHLRGFTDDLRVEHLFAEFWAGRLAPGPVPIPDAP